MSEMILFLVNQTHQFFARYPYGYPLDPYVILSPTSGGSARRGFQVQPAGHGSTGFIQPVRLAACS
jgi:hypothetical protein